MDLLLISREACANSFVSILLTAISAKKAGMEVGVLFTQEALNALAGEGALQWSPGLRGQEMRLKIADAAMARKLPILGGKGEGRELDAMGLLGWAREAGVPMFACPLWAGLIGVQALPHGIDVLDPAEAIKTLLSAKKIIGAL